MPLRRSQDYRDDSRKILEWLSRRWLYNIPRSLQTEGLRPLGRLAFVDHADTIKARLHQALQQFFEDAAAVELRPRVVIVASPSGGSGSGMVADMAFLARQLADELPGGDSMELLAVLTHGTNRNLQQQDLASANTVATLSELGQYHRPGALFPGDSACGLKPRNSGALSALYLVHVGEELGPQEIAEASDRVAEFLMLDAVTAVGNVLASARVPQADETEITLRSFNLCEFGFAHDRLLDDSVTGICRAIIRRLKGPDASSDQQKHPRLLGGGVTESTVNPFAELDQRAAAFVASLGLAVEPLMQFVQQCAAAELGGDPEAFFRKLMVAGPANKPPPVEQWVSGACDLFGRQHSDTSIQAMPGELGQALDQRMQGMIAEVGARIRAWVEETTEDPASRVTGAQRAAKHLQGYLKGLVEKFAEARGCCARECHPITAALAGLDNPDKSKSAKRGAQESATLFIQYCRLRLIDLAAQRAGQIAHALQSHAVAAYDGLVDLQRDLDHLASQFPAGNPVATAVAEEDEVAKLRSSVVQQLGAAEESLAEQISARLNQTLFTKRGGMRAVIAAGGDAREQLKNSLMAAAREAALAKVQEIDLAAILLSGQNGESPLAKSLAAAQPWLQRCGGQRRLIVVVPPQLAAPQHLAAISAQLGSTAFTQQPSVVPGASGDFVLLFELGEVSLAHAAANLISFRRDLAEAAGRLYTRCDVSWIPPFAF